MAKFEIPTLPAYLRTEAHRSFIALIKQVERTTATDSHRFRRDDWPDHRHGIGQDGSIGGIIYHVAAWKQITLPLFDANSPPVSRHDLDPDLYPERSDWPGLVDWLSRIGEMWLVRLDSLSEPEFNEPRRWEDVTITLADYVTEMYHHDIQHASQIEYLHQLIKVATNVSTTEPDFEPCATAGSR